ncbi:hypothetical protein CYMTET_56095 [Cymbomonas tetramitiformis]|uniref:Chromo domain-containing protein n=1 Tax=Cymbomonas tetramitiformis TaxID=36881 RepID=A0AAE0EMX0_9CHLO|nr:hypothetical protein CYMTET_56095 [Cymbomonas tetramitiformis]
MGGKRGRKANSQTPARVTLIAQGKGLVKRTQINPFDAAGSDNTFYSVREIKAEPVRGNTTQWLIGWEGFTDRDDTWEPIEHLARHEGDIRAFREQQKEKHEKCMAEEAARKKQRKEDNDRSVADNKAMAYCGNTTNLRAHLSSCHKDEYCKLLVAEGHSTASGDENNNDSSRTHHRTLLKPWCHRGGISIFGILVYWLDSDFQLHEHLLAAIPLSKMYDVENPVKAATAVANPDGSIYKNHQLLIEEWDIVREAMYILHYAKIAVDLLQTTQTVTANLFLPVTGKLAHIAHADTPIKFENTPVSISNEHVKKAREIM